MTNPLFKKNQQVAFKARPGKFYKVAAHTSDHGVSLIGVPGNVDPAALAPIDAAPAQKSKPQPAPKNEG